MQKIKNVINTIKEKAVDAKVEIVLSRVIHRDDQDVEDKTNKLKK